MCRPGRPGFTTRGRATWPPSNQYLPKGISIDTLGYWFPADRKAPVANDLMVNLTGGANPVLAHKFIDYMLDVNNALENYSYVGYMQPLTAVTPAKLISEKPLPPQLTSTVVLPDYFRNGLFQLELPRGRQRGLGVDLEHVLQGAVGRRDGRHGDTCDRRNRWLWIGLAAPGAIWLIVLFVAPFYVMLAVAGGGVNEFFQTVVPVWNPLHWSSWNFSAVWHDIFGSGAFLGSPHSGRSSTPRSPR